MASIINAATSGGLVTTADTSGILQLQTAGTAAVTVDASQNVGLGTSSPGYKLDVALSSSDVYSASGTTINSQQTSAIFIRNTSNTAGTNFAAIYLNSRTSGAVAARIAVTGEHSVGDGSCLAFSTRGSANTTYTEHARFTAAGRLLVGLTSANASGGVLQISNGITFPATQSASSNANTLDDYEEGTFNAGIAFGGGTTGITYVTQAGAYVKIGRMVWCSFCIQTSSKGSSTGNLTLTGLPFTSSAVNSYFAFASQGIFNMNAGSGLSGTSSVSFYSEMAGSSTSVGYVAFKTAAAQAYTAITNSNVEDYFNYQLTICYQTST
jgi:hypothetical protein